jgi:hypothetical protein
MYNTISVSPDMSWDNISRRVYGLPDRAGEIAKLNNYINSGEVLYSVEEKSTEQTKQILLKVGENSFTDFAEYRLFEGLECFKGAVFVIDNINTDIKNGDSVTICDKDGKFLCGLVRNTKPAFNSEHNWLQVEIKSFAGFLAESHINKEQLESNNLSIKDVFSKILDGFGIKYQFSNDAVFNEIFTNSIGTGFSADIQETAYNFLKRICKSRNLVMKDTGDGLFFGKIDTNQNTKLNLIDNESIGIHSATASFCTVGPGRNYEINTQFPTVSTTRTITPLTFPVLRRFSSADFNGEDVSSPQKIAATEIGENFSIIYEISTDIPIRSGDIVTVKDGRILISTETDFIVETVERADNDRSFIHLVLPCKYTGKLPKELPACRF